MAKVKKKEVVHQPTGCYFMDGFPLDTINRILPNYGCSLMVTLVPLSKVDLVDNLHVESGRKVKYKGMDFLLEHGLNAIRDGSYVHVHVGVKYTHNLIDGLMRLQSTLVGRSAHKRNTIHLVVQVRDESLDDYVETGELPEVFKKLTNSRVTVGFIYNRKRKAFECQHCNTIPSIAKHYFPVSDKEETIETSV